MDKADQGVSVIVPVLHESERLSQTISTLCSRADIDELVIADASRDLKSAIFYEQNGNSLLERYADKLTLLTPLETGRAAQMNLAAECSCGSLIFFLHADTVLPDTNLKSIQKLVGESGWGRFDVRLCPETSALKIVANMMNLRSRLTGIATGDQAIFVSRKMWRSVKGFSALALMEDIDLSRRLKHKGAPVCLRSRVETSSRRWQKNGILKTILFMWSLRLLFWFGVSTETLAGWYKHAR